MFLKIACLLLAIKGYAATECGNEEMYCSADHKCIPQGWRCDAYVGFDCSDGEDEINCSAEDCAKTSTFHCKESLTCTNVLNVCDGVKNCPNNEDEQNCQEFECPEGKIKCIDGTCVWGAICDGWTSCVDESDEKNCTDYVCPKGKYKCDDHKCVWAKKCDGWKSCQDGADETNCEEYICESQEIKCDDHTCVFGEKCDGYSNCLDGSDEHDCQDFVCPADRIKCKDGTCAPGSRCDGNSNCVDESDENDCQECEEGGFLCQKDNKCIPSGFVCDSYSDCSDTEDDRGCGRCTEDEFMCGNGKCIPYKDNICNDEDNCGDNTDENGCHGDLMIDPIPEIYPLPLNGNPQINQAQMSKSVNQRYMLTHSNNRMEPQRRFDDRPRSMTMRRQLRDRNTYRQLMLSRLRMAADKRAQMQRSNKAEVDSLLTELEALKERQMGNRQSNYHAYTNRNNAVLINHNKEQLQDIENFRRSGVLRSNAMSNPGRSRMITSKNRHLTNTKESVRSMNMGMQKIQRKTHVESANSLKAKLRDLLNVL